MSLKGKERGKRKRTLPAQGREKRGDERVDAQYPVDVGGAAGVTRNVSASGIYFETAVPYVVGSEVDLTIDLDTPGGTMKLRCRGEIVRVKPAEGRMGVAVKILSSEAGAQG